MNGAAGNSAPATDRAIARHSTWIFGLHPRDDAIGTGEGSSIEHSGKFAGRLP